MKNNLELTIQSIIEGITAQKEEYLKEVFSSFVPTTIGIESIHKHLIYLTGQIEAYNHMLYILKQEAKVNA
jgi:hypothetical protein